MPKEYIAYKGSFFTLEWYFNDRNKSEAFEYFEGLPIAQQKKILHLFALLGNMGKIFNEEKFRYEGDQIYALKSSPDRFLCFFFEDAKVIITNAYEKKMAKLPAREKEKAIKAKNDYGKRCKKGIYYD